MRSSILRAVIAVIVGVLMIMYREEMVHWLTIIIGVLFFLSGLISIVFYCVMRKRYNQEVLRGASASSERGRLARRPMVPIVGIGCAILGILLAVIPDTVADYLVYVFAIILILGAIGQFFILSTSISLLRDLERSMSGVVSMRLGYGYWVLPLLLILFGLLAIFYPHAIERAPFLFVGIAMLVYGLSELVSAIKSLSVRRFVSSNQPGEAVVVEPQPAVGIEEQPAQEAEVEDAEVIDADADAEEEQ